MEPQTGPFTPEQKEYLEGFLRAAKPIAGSSSHAPLASATDPAVDKAMDPGLRAQLAWLAAGKRLSQEEKIKFNGNPLDAWSRIAELSAQDKLPEGEDTFRLKFHGLWNVSPAQEAMMCRLRIPGGVLKAWQAEAVARAADAYGGGYVDVTTRANLQIREIPGRHMASLLADLHEAGIVPRGSGADNIRNVTGNPTCGIDPVEFFDVLPLCRQLHHHILHNRSLYGLPRKFNIAFDGGNSISSLEDTNDIGFKAVKVEEGHGIDPGVYFRLALGGITGHKDFAKDTGLLLRPEECLPVAVAMVEAYIAFGDRGNRKRARLKYVLDGMGVPAFLEETQKRLAFPLRRLPAEACRFAPPADKSAHVGIHPQRQTGRLYIGVDVPVGRLTAAQLRGLADLAARFGSGDLRLTVWQNLILPGIPGDRLAPVLEAIRMLGLSYEPDPVQSGLVACTGSEGCKFGMAPTKSTALAITAHLQAERALGRVVLDHPVNIHLTGCTHSCAQHFIGDIGLLAVSVDTERYKGGGFHVFIGGGSGSESRIAVAARRSVPVPEVPAEVARILSIYLARRLPGESLTDFTARRNDAELESLFAHGAEAGSGTDAPVVTAPGTHPETHVPSDPVIATAGARP